MSTRREFLKTSAASATGLVIAIQLPACSGDSPAAGAGLANPTEPVQANAWLRIETDGSIAFLADRSEMGQGVYTALPTLLAEELDVAVGAIRVEAAPAGDAYVNSALGVQVTGGSTSVREAYEKLRRAGAEARARLVAAAAAHWNVDSVDLRTDNGRVMAPNGESLTYGQLATSAAELPVPTDVQLKPASVFTQIGRSRQRLDTGAKVDGTATFGIDVTLPNMLHGAIAMSPVLGGKARSVDSTAAKALPGVRDVVQTSTGVVVLADTWWQARRARDALVIEWDAGSKASLNSAEFHADLRKALDERTADAVVPRNEGDVEAALAAAGARRMTAYYEEPLLAHATLEPQNCTVEQRGDEIHVHAPTQVQQLVQAMAAAAAQVPPEKVFVHTTYLGGGFGRRLEGDFVPAAVEAMKAVGRPVKLVWTREDDTTHDLYRTAAVQRCTAGFAADGKLAAWKFEICAPSPLGRWAPAVYDQLVIDPFSIEAAANYPYAVPNVRVTYLRHELGLDVGFLRSVSHATNCFAAECFMDELAANAKQDPVEFRRALLTTPEAARYRAVLDRAAERADWGQPPAGRAQGVALMEGYGTYLAMVAEVAPTDGGRVRVAKITCVVDCGQMVNPSIVEAQVQGGIVLGLSSTLWGEITIEGGRVRQQNFDTYRLVRMNEMPELDIELLPSTEAPGGIGEPSTALVAPAVANAVFAATGTRVSSLPLAKHGLV